MSNKEEKIKGLMSGLQGKADEIKIAEEIADVSEDISLDSVDITSVFAPVQKIKIVSKAFTIREDQAKNLALYSKAAKKNESEFMRDALDLLFSLIKKQED